MTYPPSALMLAQPHEPGQTRRPFMRTILYVLETNLHLDVFGDPVGQSLVLDTPLRVWQQRVAEEANLEIRFVAAGTEMETPCFVMTDDLCITPGAFKEFVERARAAGCNCQAGLANNPVVDRLAQTQPVRSVNGGFLYDLRYVVDTMVANHQPVLLVMDDLNKLVMRLPRVVSDHGGALLPHNAKSMVHIQAPLHVYQANMQYNQATIPQRIPFLRRRQPDLLRQPELMGKWNRIGQGCSIHPTAWVEGCQVGNNVTVGAYAVCSYSVLGDGAQIMEGAKVNRSVVGTNAMVGQNYRVIFSVIYPECFVTSGALQFSIIGHASGVYAAWVTDVRMDKKPVTTVVKGKVVDSGMDFLGCVLGHRSKLTAGVVSAPGRVIPNDITVYPDPAQVLTRIPEDHPAGVPYVLGR